MMGTNGGNGMGGGPGGNELGGMMAGNPGASHPPATEYTLQGMISSCGISGHELPFMG